MTHTRTAILIGVGGFGTEWWHAIEEHELEIVGLVDPNTGALETAAEHFHVPSEHCFGGTSEDWCRLPAQLIIDSSPAKFHHRHALIAMEHGLDVLVVKPMAERLSDAVHMVHTAQRLGRKLVVAHQKRFLPGFLKLREIVLSGIMGRLGNVHIDLNIDGTFWEPGWEWRRHMAHPLLLDGSIHHFDLMRWILGREPVSIMADSFNPPWSVFEGDACLSAFVEMSEGLHVNYRASWSPRNSELITFFSGWQLEFDGGCVILKDGEVFINGVSTSDDQRPTEAPPLSTLNIDVVRYFFSNADTPEVNGLLGLNNLASIAMMEACLKSFQVDRKVSILQPMSLDISLSS